MHEFFVDDNIMGLIHFQNLLDFSEHSQHARFAFKCMKFIPITAIYRRICKSRSLKIGAGIGQSGIATRYGLDGPGIKSRWRRDFPHLSRPTLGPTQPPIQWEAGLSWG